MWHWLHGLLRRKVILSGLLRSWSHSTIRRCLSSKRSRHNLNRCLNKSRKPRSCSRRSLNRRLTAAPGSAMEGARDRRAGSNGCAGIGWFLCDILIIVSIQCLHNRSGGAGDSSDGIGCSGCTGAGVIVKGIIPPEDEVPPEGKVPPATGSGPG